MTGKGNYKDSATGKWGIGLITPTITSVPTASAITYGQTLKDSVLAGGVAKAGDTVVEGTFEWKKPGTAPAVSDSEVTAYEAVFIPKDTEIFWMAECGVTLTVNKANSTPATVTANNRSYDGKKEPLVTVDESTLVGGMMAYALGRNAAAAPDASAYTAAIPKDDGAGTYYVWYCVRGDENHLDSAAACVTVKIASQEKPGGRVLPKLEPKGNNALKLSWTKMTHVDGYDVYFTDGDKSFKKTPTASVGADVSEYVFKGLKKKSIHKAYVRAYVMEKGEKSYVSDRMNMISIVGGSSDDYTVPAKVKAKDLKLAVGAKQKIKPTVVGKDSKKKVLSLNKGRLYYISLDPSIAKVSDDGTVRAVKEGTARILVIACNGVRTTVKVTVGQGPDKLSFGKKKYTVKAGKTIDLYKLLKISPKNAMVSLTWKSSNKKIATVNEKGVVTGVKKGTVTITVTDASGVKTTVKIEVKKAKK